MSDIPRPPKGTKTAGRKLWNAVLADYELSEHETTLLTQACRTADACADLQDVIDAEGPMTIDRFGEPRTNPALIELRNQRALLARLIVALRVPLGDAETTDSRHSPAPRRSQRRGVRGFHSINGGAS